MPVATKSHEWIKIEVSPVSVLPGLDGEPVIFIDPEEDVMVAYSCQFCSEDLDAATMGHDCPGETP